MRLRERWNRLGWIGRLVVVFGVAFGMLVALLAWVFLFMPCDQRPTRTPANEQLSLLLTWIDGRNTYALPIPSTNPVYERLKEYCWKGDLTRGVFSIVSWVPTFVLRSDFATVYFLKHHVVVATSRGHMDARWQTTRSKNEEDAAIEAILRAEAAKANVAPDSP